jgi:hypothetical protein
MKGAVSVVQTGAARCRTSTTRTWSLGKGERTLRRDCALSSSASGSRDAVFIAVNSER